MSSSSQPHTAEIPGTIPGHYTDNLDLHTSNLFDHDGTVHGDYLDPATGKRIDNSTFEDISRHGLFDESGRQIGSIKDPAKQRRNKQDTALAWLAKHDPEYDRSHYL